ncbi:DUF2971 domain-containing protein [Microbacterium sp. NPDC057407]|uniref:DUF2971 domain-containing protein n=1 Tax=Microbacterium sp. NPDC057407 TaxID=3346120 RepID=UPI00366C2EE4
MTFLMRPRGQGAELLFHYTSAAGLAGILDSGHLRLSTLDRMNDPRESGTYNFGWRQASPGPFDGERMASMTEEMNIALRRTTHLVSFTVEGTEESADGYFGRGFARARNWDQYGEKHRGAVLVFDRDRTLAAVSELSAGSYASGPVRYVDGSLQSLPDGGWLMFEESEYLEVGPAAMVERWRHDYRDQLFLTKNKDWESEDEFRILVWRNEHASIPIAGLLEGVILGEHHPVPERRVLGTRLARLGIDRLMIGIMEWRHGTPGCHNSLLPDGSFGFEFIDDGVDQNLAPARPIIC